jgi:hypothetical protein
MHVSSDDMKHRFHSAETDGKLDARPIHRDERKGKSNNKQEDSEMRDATSLSSYSSLPTASRQLQRALAVFLPEQCIQVVGQYIAELYDAKYPAVALWEEIIRTTPFCKTKFGAHEEAVQELETELELKLPTGVRELLKLSDGCEADGPMSHPMKLFPSIAEIREQFYDGLKAEDNTPVMYRRLGLLPFGDIATDDCYRVLDLESGIILLLQDEDGHHMEADSLPALLEAYRLAVASNAGKQWNRTHIYDALNQTLQDQPCREDVCDKICQRFDAQFLALLESPQTDELD